MYVNIKQ